MQYYNNAVLLKSLVTPLATTNGLASEFFIPHLLPKCAGSRDVNNSHVSWSNNCWVIWGWYGHLLVLNAVGFNAAAKSLQLHCTLNIYRCQTANHLLLLWPISVNWPYILRPIEDQEHHASTSKNGEAWISCWSANPSSPLVCLPRKFNGMPNYPPQAWVLY